MTGLRQSLQMILGLALSVGVSGAAVAFSNHPVTIIVSHDAGSVVDTVSRAASEQLGEALGHPVVVKNHPGADEGAALAALKSTPPDGHTIVATTSTTLTFDPHARDVGFDVDDFEYIAAFGVFPRTIFALPGRDWRTFADAINEARRGYELTYASNRLIDRVIMQAIAEREGVDIRPIETKGGAESIAHVLVGHVDFGFGTNIDAAQATAEGLHVLAGLGDYRVPGLADTPSLRDMGYDVSSADMILFLVRKGLGGERKARLIEAFAEAGRNPTVLAALKSRNLDQVVLVGDEIEKTIYDQSTAFEASFN